MQIPTVGLLKSMRYEKQICIFLFFFIYLYTSSYDNIIKQFYSGLVTEMYLETSVFKI